MLDILKAPNPILMKVSEPLSIDEGYSPGKVIVPTPVGVTTLPVFISVMVATMYSNPACGLASPQLGVLKRIIVYNPEDADENDIKDTDATVIMINPIITYRSADTGREIETCLSLPGIEASIKRHVEVEVVYLDEDLNSQTKRVTDWEAKIIQHEVDHLDGKLYWDYLGPLKAALMNKYRIAKRRNRHGK